MDYSGLMNFSGFSIYIYGKFIIPTDELHHFSEGWRKTTNQRDFPEIEMGVPVYPNIYRVYKC